MLFGEYELSPGLIGLSLLPQPHPEAFQRLSVRPSIPCYRDFSLDWGRSPGFASAAADLTPCSDSLSLRLRASSRLTSPATATRRLIMQKARRHTHKACSDRLWAHGFRDSFTPLQEVLFTFPSRYWFTIGLRRVFSLGGWARRIHTGFHVPRATQEHHWPRQSSRKGLSPAAAPLSRGFRSTACVPSCGSYNPVSASTDAVWALPRSLATTGGITVVFSSCGY